MFVAAAAQLNDELALIQAARARHELDRTEAIGNFVAATRAHALQVASDAAGWQEAVLHRHRRLERTIALREIDPPLLGEMLARGCVADAIASLRVWGAHFALGACTGRLSEVEMAVIAVAAEDARDFADILELGVTDDDDPGPARADLPDVLRAVAGGASVAVHPAVYVEVAAGYGISAGWSVLPPCNSSQDESELENAFADGLRPASVVLNWLRATDRFPALRAGIERRIAALTAAYARADVLLGDA